MTVQQPPTSLSMTLADDGTLTAAFQMDWFIGGIVIIPNGWTAANMGFKVSDSEAGTYVILRDEDGAPVQIGTILTSAARAYKIPNEVFPARWVKLWSKSATAATEDDVAQAGGPLTFTVMLK
jgi:hypothetical protein